MLVTLARWFLVLLAIVLSPLYGLWIGGGRIADRCEKRRHRKFHRTDFNEVNGQFDGEWR